MKGLTIILLGLMATGCASTMEQANIECSRGRIAAFQDEDFKMNCQEHSIKEYRGLPQPQTQIIYVQPPVQQQPQVVYVQPQPQVNYVQPQAPQVQTAPATSQSGYTPNQGGAGFGGRKIISRVGR